MMKAFFLSLALLLLGTAVSASGADTPSVTTWEPTGNDLVVSCAANISSFEYGACLGYIHGVIGGFDMGASGQKSIEIKGRPTIDLCVPNGVTNWQIVKVIMAYTEKHPEQLHQPADVIVTKAIAEAWPTETETEKGHVCTNVLLKEKP